MGARPALSSTLRGRSPGARNEHSAPPSRNGGRDLAELLQRVVDETVVNDLVEPSGVRQRAVGYEGSDHLGNARGIDPTVRIDQRWPKLLPDGGVLQRRRAGQQLDHLGSGPRIVLDQR